MQRADHVKRKATELVPSMPYVQPQLVLLLLALDSLYPQTVNVEAGDTVVEW